VFKFNDVFPNGVVPTVGAVVHDSVSNVTASLFNGVSLAKGKAVFASRGSKFPTQYIQLPYDYISYAGVATIEAWVRFEATNNPLSTLFSFGSFNKEIAYPSKLFTNGTKGAVDVFIAIVFNTKLKYSKVYVDGSLKSTLPLNVTTNAGGSRRLQRAATHWDFIGRNARNSTPGLTASIDELRITFGELDDETIYNDFIVGVDPSHVTIPATKTMSDLALNFYSTSTQPVEIGFFGGASKYPMFGQESVFKLTPIDTQCAYNVTARMNPQTSSFKSVVAAMNYTVEFVSGAPAPKFAADACDTTNSAGTKCFCDNSKTPLQYLTDAGELSQDIIITNTDSTPYVLEFVYHSGLCFEVMGSETFSLVEGNKTIVNGVEQSCFSTGSTILAKGQNKSVNVILFERDIRLRLQALRLPGRLRPSLHHQQLSTSPCPMQWSLFKTRSVVAAHPCSSHIIPLWCLPL